jgi:hypothetical protein
METTAVNPLAAPEALGGHEPALTVVIAGIYDPAWLLEIEAIAAAWPVGPRPARVHGDGPSGGGDESGRGGIGRSARFRLPKVSSGLGRPRQTPAPHRPADRRPNRACSNAAGSL